MLKKKIASAVAALAMAATMSVSALSASAACVHNPDGSCAGNGHFYVWNDIDNDGVVDDGELTYVSHTEGLIDGNPTLNADGTVTIALQEMLYHGVTGEITEAYEADGTTPIDISDGTLTTTPDTVIVIVISYNGHPGGNPIKVVFKIGPCDCNNCNC